MNYRKPGPIPSAARGLCRALLFIAIAGSAGCVSYSFKRGASPDAMAADEQACHAAEGDFRSCMRDRGWFIATSLPEPEPVATDGGSAAKTAPASSATSAFDSSPADTSRPSTGAEASTAPALATAASPAASTTPPPRAGMKKITPIAVPNGPSDDPMTPLAVGSWWKFGGTAGGLDNDIASCVGKLGNAHRPEPAATVVTRAMYACLKEHGWYAFGK